MVKAVPAEPAPVEPKPQRTFAKDVNINVGLVNMVTDLVPVKQGDTTKKFNIACPDCSEATKMDQQYVCPTDPTHIHTSGTAARVKEVDGMLYKVAEEELREAKAPTLPPGSLELLVFPAAQVEQNTRANGTVYRVRPKTKGSMGVYAALRAVIAESEYAFIGEMTMRSEQKLFRAEVWNDQIVLQELARPQELAPVDVIDVVATEKELKLVKTLVASVAEDFDPSEFRDRTKERIAEFVAEVAKNGGKPVAKKARATSAKDEEASLINLLELAVADAKAKRKERKAS